MTEMMKAVVTTTDANKPLIDKKIERPNMSNHDVLVRVAAAGMNPVDMKQWELAAAAGQERVLGFDAVGEIVAMGDDVTKFAIGDRVFFAGELGRTGSNAEYEVVREALISEAPSRLSNVEAAAMPLTFLTAYEMLADKFQIEMVADGAKGETLFVINGAGGVGSMMIQLGKWLGMTVIATASRQDTIDWVKKLGADFVVNHCDDYVTAVKKLGFTTIPYIAVLHSLDQHFESAAKLVDVFGHIGAIVQSTTPLPVGLIKNQAASLDWEFMFAKTNAGKNVATQGAALTLLAKLVDEGVVQSTLTKTMTGLSAKTILAAQREVAIGNMIGKLVIEY